MIKSLLLISALVGMPIVGEVVEPNSIGVMVEEEVPPVEEEAPFDWEEWLTQWFTPQQVAMIMTWITYITTIITIVYKLYRMGKDKNLTTENLKVLIMNEIGDKVDASVKEQITAIAVPLLKTSRNQEEVLKVLTKVMALAQENTPESRLAILNCISQLGVIETELVEQAKETITEQVKTEQVKQEETANQVEQIINETSNTDDGTRLV